MTIMAALPRSTVWQVSDRGRRADGGGFGRWLGARSDAELAALLATRPDLVSPAPTCVDALAARATTRLSLERALNDLDQFALHVIEALVVLPCPVPTGRVQELLAVPAAPLRRCLAELCGHALAFDTGEGWRPAPGLRAAVGEPWLAGRPGRISPEPPPLDVIQNGSREVDHAAATAALRSLRATEGMLSRWGAAPPPVLKSGGLGIRELRKTATSVKVDVRAAVLYTEVARAAGLLAASGWVDGEWLPSRAFDTWREAATRQRWAALVCAWLATTRVPGLVGARDECGRLRGALGAGLDRVDAPRVRSWVLGQLAAVAPGESVSVAAILNRLAWRWPRGQHPLQVMLAETTVEEAALLGLTGLGALSVHGRALVRGGPAAAATALEAILPQPVGYVVLQGDLTAVAPGPLTAELDRELTLAAEVESTGGATVYRFSADSVRRALDAGRSGEDLLVFLEERSRTPVPQPLRYLIGDVARRHGQVRAGTAAAYLRCDDPVLLAEIAADRRAAGLRLRQLAPTVLISASSRADVLTLLRQLGYAPAAESADGALEITRASTRAEDRSGKPVPGVRPGVRSGARPGALSGMRPGVLPVQPGDQPRVQSGVQPAHAPWPAEKRALAAVRVLRSGDA